MEHKPPRVILLIDDEPQVVATVTSLLRKFGFAVITPPTRFTPEQIAAMPCDLLLTDMVMSPVPGPLVIKAVRRVKPDLPIIAFTGHGWSMPEKLGEMVGADRYLDKPLLGQVLAEAINGLLRQHGKACAVA